MVYLESLHEIPLLGEKTASLIVSHLTATYNTQSKLCYRKLKYWINVVTNAGENLDVEAPRSTY